MIAHGFNIYSLIINKIEFFFDYLLFVLSLLLTSCFSGILI